jgi:hypothetical protein
VCNCSCTSRVVVARWCDVLGEFSFVVAVQGDQSAAQVAAQEPGESLDFSWELRRCRHSIS